MNLSPEIYNILVQAHSAGRWLLLLFLLVAIFRSLSAGNRPYNRGDNSTGLVLTIVTDLMFLVGVVLYFAGNWGYKLFQQMSTKEIMNNSVLRFFAVEHITLMLIAVILIHIGKAQGRKNISDRARHRRTLIFYFIALLVILVAVPWPFREGFAGRGWI
jgi:L-asparagine transporter-like permease